MDNAKETWEKFNTNFLKRFKAPEMQALEISLKQFEPLRSAWNRLKALFGEAL